MQPPAAPARQLGAGKEFATLSYLGNTRETATGDYISWKGLARLRIDRHARVGAVQRGRARRCTVGGQPRCGKVSGELVWIGHVVVGVRSVNDPPALIVRQEEAFVAPVVDLRYPYRAAKHIAELVLSKLWNGCLEIRPGIVGVVAVELEYRSVELVRAALADQVDLVGAEAKLGRVGLRSAP